MFYMYYIHSLYSQSIIKETNLISNNFHIFLYQQLYLFAYLIDSLID
jgi:hypothetical protein